MPDIPPTRQSLLIELGKRDDDAWAEFLHVYESAIYGACRAKGLQDADARDVTQEVLAAVHQRLPSWDPDAAKGSFRAWLFRVARNISVDSIADRARRGAHGGSHADRLLAEIPDAREDSRETFDLEYRRALFDWASTQVRSEVRDVTWQAFLLTAVHGSKAKDAAEQLGIPVGSVYTAKCRVVARIRARVASMGNELTDDPDDWPRTGPTAAPGGAQPEPP